MIGMTNKMFTNLIFDDGFLMSICENGIRIDVLNFLSILSKVFFFFFVHLIFMNGNGLQFWEIMTTEVMQLLK